MNTYNVNWKGLDRGHESAWRPSVWRGVLKLFAKYSPVDLSETGSEFFKQLKANFPKTQWVTKSNGQTRTFFRDGREPWVTTGVVYFDEDAKTASITQLGQRVCDCEMTYSDVLFSLMNEYSENGEYPFRIILKALQVAPVSGLSYEDIARVMCHFREGDDIQEVLQLPDEALGDTAERRLKAMLKAMLNAGMAILDEGRYHPGLSLDKKSLLNLENEFRKWLKDVYRKENGTAVGQSTIDTYANVLKYLADKDSHPGVYDFKGPSYWCNMYHFLYGIDGPSVFTITSESELRERFAAIIAAVNLKEAPNGVNIDNFNKVKLWCQEPNVKKSGWVKSGLNRYTDFLQWREQQRSGNERFNPGDILSVALKMFADKRASEEWCSDKTDGDPNKPRPGYVANLKRRVGAAAIDTPQHIREWFGHALYPNSWEAITAWKSIVDELEDGDLNAFGPYLEQLNQSSAPELARPPKFTRSIKSVARNMIAPDSSGVYDEQVHKALVSLGLIGFEFNVEFSPLDYDDVMHAQRVILRRLIEMKLPQVQEFGKTYEPPPDPNWKDADYLTVNEFLWFVNSNLKDIKNEVVKMALTPVTHNAYDRNKGKTKTFSSSEEDQLMLRILAALRTKPFVILAGHSGTGKSRMVKRLAYMTCRDNTLHEGSDPGNYCMIEVKPNWHDSTELLGYASSFGGDHYVVKPLIEFIQKAYAFPDVPFFVCLDEMNLAPVEQYFAEFLSALEDIHEDTTARDKYLAKNQAYKPETGSAAEEVIKYTSAPLIKSLDYKNDPALLIPHSPESKDWVETHGLTIPKNLFVVGTVNMDETTNQFSRKVLDRAFTIEMTDARFEDFGDNTKDPPPAFVSEEDTDHKLIDALLTGKKQSPVALTKKANPGDQDEPNGQLENMNALKQILSGTPFVVAYRFANEYALYEDALNTLDEKDEEGNPKKAANAMKAFDEVVLMKLLPRIAGETSVVRALYEGKRQADGSKKDGLLGLLQYSEESKTASGKKMQEILQRKDAPYLTFWP